MGGRNNRKRKLAQFVEDGDHKGNYLGIGATVAHLREADENKQTPQGTDKQSDLEDWTTIGRGGKKLKKSTYPSLGYSELHKLQSMIKVDHLQGLVLYCLADGMAPSWISISHHHMIKKAVILFVPGLERGMLDGSIELNPSEEHLIDLEEDLIDFTNQGKGSCSSKDQIHDTSKLPQRADPVNPFKAQSDTSGPLIDFSSNENGSTESVLAQVGLQGSVPNNLKQPVESKASSNKPPVQSPDNYLPIPLTREKLPSPMKPLADCFKHMWPVKAPGDDRFGKVHSPLHAMLNSPIPKTQEDRREDKQVKGPKPAKEGRNWENKRTSITEFISSKEELQENEYVLHHVWFPDTEGSINNFGQRFVNKHTTDDGWVDTKVSNLAEADVPDRDVEKGSVTAGRSILSMDCEMCKVEGGEMALTRISLVKWDGTILLDELVKPEKAIIDYLTPYSGITPAKLEKVTTTLKDIQARLMTELTSKHILIGHSLNSDFFALKLTHPFIIDTSILYPHPRGPPMKSSLKWLSQKYLNREIQKGHSVMGHDSVEDARACLDLVKLKCARGPQWGTSEATNESIFKRLKRTSKVGAPNDGHHGKTGAIIDHGFPDRNFGSMASYCIGCSTDAEVVAGVKRAVLGDADGIYIPGGGVDFTWARFQELAAIQGWLLDYRNGNAPKTNAQPSTAALRDIVSKTVEHIKTIHDFLPPSTLLIVCSGTGDPREMARLQEVQRTFKREYRTKKWDELSVKWTDTEEQGLKTACRTAREGIGFLTITNF